MKSSLISYIWAFSRRDQLVLVVVTCLLFPLLYLTLELPKRIINDAISAPTDVVTFFGIEFAQKTLLVLLCIGFLGAVTAHGLLKMRVNTMKGVLAERLLRRLRYTLITHILRFPVSYQSKTSEGELVSMVTAETEPLGGIMGDAIAHPLLQAGQMLTILLFLFLQSVWFGIAACALIPLQAWIIPRLQRQINLLNRSRIKQVRALASDIGEITTGAATLRQNSGWRYRMAQTSDRLAGLFETRFMIYKRKFFMKFLNNFLNQLTPFMFFLVGGLLVIDGHLTVGALVAALSAFKDLSSPWKELLTYYTASVEMGQRYELVVERFTPAGLLSDYISEEPTIASPDVTDGMALSLDKVSLLDREGQHVLQDASLDVPRGQWLCLAMENDYDRAAFVQLMLRELQPASGTVQVAGQGIAAQGQADLAARIGHVTARPYVFKGTLGENILLPLMARPTGDLSSEALVEAERTGNSADAPLGAWLPASGAQEDLQAAQAEWVSLLSAIGAHKVLLQRALETTLDAKGDGRAKAALLALRTGVWEALATQSGHLPGFHKERYSDGLTLPENLLFAVSSREAWLNEEAAQSMDALLRTLGLREQALDQSIQVANLLIEAFDPDAAENLLLRQLNLPAGMLSSLHDMAKGQGGSLRATGLTAEDEALLLSLVFNVPSSRFDRAFSDDIKAEVVAARARVPDSAHAGFADAFERLDFDRWADDLRISDNLIFGKLNELSRARRDEIRALLTDLLAAELDPLVLSDLISNLPTELRGSNLTPQINEVISLAQTIVKKPALVILDDAMPSYDAPVRAEIFAQLRERLPEATILQIEREAPAEGEHDRVLTLNRGTFEGGQEQAEGRMAPAETSDLRRKLQAIRKAPLFSGLSTQQLRMLAFSARWVEYDAGAYVFRQNDAPDGAYLIYEGDICLTARKADGSEDFTVYPMEGTLVGELGLIRNEPRRLDMRADSQATLLRIEAEDFLTVIESDAQTAFKLIRVLIGYLDRPN